MRPLAPLRTLRGRLTLWYSTVFGGLLLVLGAMSFVSLDRALRDNLDDSLVSAARTIAASSGDREASNLAETLESLLGPALAERFFQLLDPLGRPDPRLTTRRRPALALSVSALRNAEQGRETFETIVLPGAASEVRLLTWPVLSGGRLVNLVQVAMPLERVEAARSRFLWVRLALAPLALAATALGGWFLAGRALRPVDAMVANARRISSEDLSLRLAGENRDDELGRLAAVLNEMLARLERSFAGARQFSADAAHELRTPLTILKGELGVALRKASLDDATSAALESCVEEVDRLAALVEDLLFLARADADAVSFAREPVDLAALAADAAPALHALAEAADVALTLEAGSPVVVRGSESLLFRVLMNLAENAIKYAGSGRKVTVTVRRDGGDALLEVSDTGPGIPAADLERIFDRFYRADPARSRSGTGLGLALARSIVRVHGGTIRVDSPPGGGTCFRVRLPPADPVT